jgi:hypothetical protein
MELDITIRATLGLDMPTEMLALAIEATEASQRECIMVFDGAATAPIARSRGTRARPPERRRIDALRWIRDSGPGGRPRNAAFGERLDLLRSRAQAVSTGPEYLTK